MPHCCADAVRDRKINHSQSCPQEACCWAERQKSWTWTCMESRACATFRGIIHMDADSGALWAEPGGKNRIPWDREAKKDALSCRIRKSKGTKARKLIKCYLQRKDRMQGWSGRQVQKGGLWTLLGSLKCHQMTSVDLCCSSSVGGRRGKGLEAKMTRSVPDVEVSVSSWRSHGSSSGASQWGSREERGPDEISREPAKQISRGWVGIWRGGWQ